MQKCLHPHTSISIICPIIVSEGSRPSRKKFPMTSSIRFLRTGNRCNSFTRQRWLIWTDTISKLIWKYMHSDKIHDTNMFLTFISSSYMNLAHWRLGSNNRAICLLTRFSKGTYMKDQISGIVNGGKTWLTSWMKNRKVEIIWLCEKV